MNNLNQNTEKMMSRQSIYARLHLRTRELAVLAGRLPHNVNQIDYEQAKRDVTGESNLSRATAILDGIA